MSGKAILKEIGSTLLYIVVVLGITWLADHICRTAHGGQRKLDGADTEQ